MQRRKFSREFKIEAVRLVGERGVSVAQASRDIDVHEVYRTRDAARADVFDYIERFYNTIRRHSTNGYLSPVEFERKVGLA